MTRSIRSEAFANVAMAATIQQAPATVRRAPLVPVTIKYDPYPPMICPRRIGVALAVLVPLMAALVVAFVR